MKKNPLFFLSVLLISGSFLYSQNYKSDYKPFHGASLPVINIDSHSKNEDFVTKPLSYGVKKQMLTWGQTSSKPDPWYEDCSISITDENGQAFMDKALARVKVRGNWTSSYDKKSVRIKFQEKQGMLGLNGGEEFKNWVLLSSYKDWSMLRDFTAQYISKLISPYYSSDCRLVEVYINKKYWGVYLLAELQEVSKNRINITKPKGKYEGTDIGYLLEHDSYYKYEDPADTFILNYQLPIKDIEGKEASEKLLIKGFTIKSDLDSPKQRDFIENYMTLLWKLCYEAAYNNKFYKFNDEKSALIPSEAKDCLQCISPVIEVDSLICMYVLSEIYCDADLYWTSFYMDLDLGPEGKGKLTFEAPWDFDSALGNKNFCSDGKGYYAARLGYDTDLHNYGTCNPWMMIFVSCDWFQALVKEKWKQVQEAEVCKKIVDNIHFISNQYEEAFKRNQKRWKNAGQAWRFGTELSKEAAACKSQKQAADFLATWLERRFTGLDQLWGQ
ncbi:MAG: CotH kinase family protein [Treponema sp.]|nr:CotH kinase family protein [Treponema sp.]